jgi:hypothetical protein
MTTSSVTSGSFIPTLRNIHLWEKHQRQERLSYHRSVFFSSMTLHDKWKRRQNRGTPKQTPPRRSHTLLGNWNDRKGTCPHFSFRSNQKLLHCTLPSTGCIEMSSNRSNRWDPSNSRPEQQGCEELARALEHLRPVVPPIRGHRYLRPLVPLIGPWQEEEDDESISSVETEMERPVSVTEDEEHNLYDTDSDTFGTDSE